MSNDAITGFRLSIQQERIWSQCSETISPFWAQCEVSVAGPLDYARLHSAVEAVVARYEVLRTVFHRHAGFTVPFQVIVEEPVFAWSTQDLSAQSEDVQSSTMLQLAESCLASVDVEKGPCLSAVAVKIGSNSYRLLLAMPALCADARSLELLVQEIFRSYEQSGKTPDDVMQYADIAEWQQELLASDEAKPALDFWRNYCRDIDFSAAATVLKSYTCKQPAEFASRSVEVPFESGGNGLPSKFDDILLAAFVVWVSRIGASPAATLGYLTEGRHYTELADALGAFARVLPFSMEYSDALAFADVVEKVAKTKSEFALWQDGFQWGSVLPASNQASGFTLPLAFEYRRQKDDWSVQELAVSLVCEDVCAERFLLKLEAIERAGTVSLSFRYDAGQLGGALVSSWARSFQTLLQTALKAPNTPVGHLPLLDRSEFCEITEAWNNTRAEYPRDKSVHAFFEAQADLHPDSPAVRFQDDVLSYQALNERANQLAHYLQQKGVGPGSFVAICLDRSASVIVTMLGVLKSGAAYVPLSGDHPKARLLGQLSGVSLLVTESKFASLAAEFSGEKLFLDQDADVLASCAKTNPDVPFDSDNVAYVIYTSGSTGVPKGVAIRHRNLVNYTTAIQERLERASQPAPLHFATVSTFSADLGNTCIFPSLFSGGCLHVISNEVAADSQRLAEYQSKYPIDVLKIVPSHLMALLNSGGGRAVLPRTFLVLGGETFSAALLEKVQATGASCEVLNHYGPTETTVGSLTLRLRDFSLESSLARTIPIGRPLQNTRVYVLDQHGAPVPVGVPGELYIAGDGVAAGYLGQPELTAERFFPEGFGQPPDSVMYRTGDLVRYVEGGNVEFLGRVDDQVKIRGFRIELAEIEAALLKHDGVEQAAVLVLNDERGDKSLVAYFVGSADVADLRSHLRDQLPEYMLPSSLLQLPRMPLNANGKIDRGALPRPETLQHSAKELVTPRTPTEEVVAAIWAEVLKRDDTSVEDNFFEIGGHSLLATQIAARLREHFKVAVPVRAVFEAPSIAELARRMDTTRRQELGLLPPAIVPVPRNGGLPLSYAQERLWVLDQIEPNNPLYNIPRSLRLRGPLNTAALERALDEIVRRHESQRTSFAAVDGHAVQVVAPELKIGLAVHDLSNRPEVERESEARRLAIAEVARPFDLSRLPLLRASLFTLAPEDHIFLLTMHHIISDAWSAGIFLQELTALYEAFSGGKPSPLNEVDVQYGDYAVQERAWLQGEAMDTQLSFWRERLKGVPPVISLPLDRARPEVRTFAGAGEIFHVPAELLAGVKALVRKEGATLFMALMAVFQAMLFKYSGDDQIVVGTDLANRTMPQTEEMIGFFINLLAVRTDLSGDPSFRELLGRVRETLLESYAHQEVPFPKVVQEVQPERSSTHNPIVQVLFVMQNTPRARRELSGLHVEPFELPVTTSKFDMALFVNEVPQGLKAYWVYSTELFESESIHRMWRHYCNLLEDAVTHPDSRLSALKMFSAEELAHREAERSKRKLSQFSKLKSAAPASVGLGAGDDKASS